MSYGVNKLWKPSYRGRDVGTERSGGVSWPSVRPELEVSASYDSYDVLLAKGLSLKLQSEGSKVRRFEGSGPDLVIRSGEETEEIMKIK